MARRYLIPGLAFIIVFSVNSFLGQWEVAFFSLYLSAVIVSAYFSGTPAALIVTTALFIIRITVDRETPVTENAEALYRLLFFVVTSLLSIVLIRRMKLAIAENIRLQKSQRELLSIVSHDLRNPLKSIRLNTEFILRNIEKGNSEKAPAKLQTILRNCNSMNVLIEDLISMGRVDQKKSLELAPVKTADLFLDVEEFLGPLARAKNIRFTVTDHCNLTFSGDHQKLLRVFSNLIGNAIKFTPPDGTIKVAATATDTAVIFTVADSGEGISEEELPKIFGRYWQAGTHEKKGLGLGLAISQSIVKAHHGTITVASVKHQGTTFTISLPR